MTQQALPKKNNLGQVKVVGGAVVITPPDDQTDQESSSTSTVVEVVNGTITVKVEGEQDTSQVSSNETELLSNASAAQVREENTKAQQEAQVLIQPRKAGNSVVASGTFNDLNLPEYDSAVQNNEPQPHNEDDTPTPSASDKKQKKKSSAEEAFQAALQDALDEQSEEFVEAYEED